MLELLLGGPTIAGIIHRVAAVVMVAVFGWHILYAAIHIARHWKSFKVFGPYSLMPNWQDAADAMFKWFFGRGPRPTFDHWNYQQKVDYWAPFWGIAMLAATGAVLWFKTLAAAFLPGWIFNVATVRPWRRGGTRRRLSIQRTLFRELLAARPIPARRRHFHGLDAARRIQARIRR